MEAAACLGQGSCKLLRTIALERIPITEGDRMSSQDWITTPITASLVRGAAELEQTTNGVLPHRLPAWARKQCSDPQLAMVEAQPSGVRIVFRTRATVIEIDTLRTRTTYAGIPPRPDGVVDLVIDGHVVAHSATSGGTTRTIDMSTGGVDQEVGTACTTQFADLSDAMKTVEIWLPHNEITEIVELRTNASVELASASGLPIWLHHGSSISHGSNAAHPSATWPAVAARLGGTELVNLGLGGSCLLDPFIARTIRDSAADVISLKIGINLVNADLMRLRAFGSAVHGYLDTIRDGHPNIPLLIVSPIYCGIHEETPGPGAFDFDALAEGVLRFRATGDPAERAAGKLSLTVIREELDRIVRERQTTDPNLFYLDGRNLYDENDAITRPLPDALHPDAATHQLMGERFARLAFAEDGPLALPAG
ncbi:GDSL-like lipase/acylhydrolase family protein [Antricoccus suffuscus]|uniref:GDSL-like lipase/acylhydrolase family protein n=2 Tax=Antricoccus suffuscus TaxID=1629062 RepID=A0A2T1A191_9ACTN|nr:GDSL-like lipase/acylhydrolase family protein [Antricoccus suffuscus]